MLRSTFCRSQSIRGRDNLASSKALCKRLFQSPSVLRETVAQCSLLAIQAREFANYLNCGATQPSTTRGTGRLQPVKTGAFFPPLSVERLSTPSVTKLQAKSPLVKPRQPGLQYAQRLAVRLSLGAR